MAKTYEELEKEFEEIKIKLFDCQERLRLAFELVSDTIVSRKDQLALPLLEALQETVDICDTESFSLENIQDRMSNKEESIDLIVVSCDASITKNPGGEVAVGFVIRFPKEDRLKTIKLSKRTPSRSNNEGEYDAIYEALVHLFNMINTPKHPIEVRSDSQLVVKQLIGEWRINEPSLRRKAQSIHELVSATKYPVKMRWMRRNSTPDLAEANFLAQDELGVKRH
jgi:ribonuclease HI